MHTKRGQSSRCGVVITTVLNARTMEDLQKVFETQLTYVNIPKVKDMLSPLPKDFLHTKGSMLVQLLAAILTRESAAMVAHCSSACLASNVIKNVYISRVPSFDLYIPSRSLCNPTKALAMPASFLKQILQANLIINVSQTSLW